MTGDRADKIPASWAAIFDLRAAASSRRLNVVVCCMIIVINVLRDETTLIVRCCLLTELDPNLAQSHRDDLPPKAAFTRLGGELYLPSGDQLRNFSASGHCLRTPGGTTSEVPCVRCGTSISVGLDPSSGVGVNLG